MLYCRECCAHYIVYVSHITGIVKTLCCPLTQIRLFVNCTNKYKTNQKVRLVEIDHEIFSTVILSLPLIQEGQLSVSGERMCTILVNCLED